MPFATSLQNLEQNNEYVGTTYGNIMDFYDNATYNLRLYMIRSPEGAPDEVASESDTLVADPKDTVILAQTGVTGAVIDDLSIENRITSTIATTDVSFTIKQPGAADFIDQLQLARAYLGIENTVSTTLFLEIVFKGYTSDLESHEEGGVATQFAGPYRFKLSLVDLSIEVDQTGSTYEMTCRPLKTFAYKHPTFKLPMQLSTVGTTITEHVRNLEEKIKGWKEDAATNEVPDQITFDLSKMIGTSDPSSGGQSNSPNMITEETLLSNADGNAETLNRLMNEIWQAGDAVDAQQQLESAPSYTGEEAEQYFEEGKLTFNERTSIDKVFLTYLSMCPEFYGKVSRKVDPLDPASEVKLDQAFVSWFRILGEVEQLEYDPVRKDYAYKYMFQPILYQTCRDDVCVHPDENEALSKEHATARLQKIKENGSLFKSYQYLFTGLNDQILDLNLKYDSGVAILSAPKGGAIGDAAITDPARNATQTPAEEDITLEGTVRNLMDKASAEANLDKVTGFFDKLKSAIDDGKDALGDSFFSGLSNMLGGTVDPAEIKSMIASDNQEQALELINSLTGAELNRLAADAEINETQNPATEDQTITTGVEGGEYTPEISGYAYSADILSMEDLTQSAVDASDLLKLGYLSIPPEDAEDALTVKQLVETGVDVPDATSNATYETGSPRNKLFGFLVNAHAARRFLITLDMTVRGDPWYLGSPQIARSTETSANYYRDDNCFWIEIRSPITYDPDFTDEDSDQNSGYWRYDGVSRTFSALYRMISVTNNFSGGMFTTDINAVRTKIDATNLDKTSTASEQRFDPSDDQDDGE